MSGEGKGAIFVQMCFVYIIATQESEHVCDYIQIFPKVHNILNEKGFQNVDYHQNRYFEKSI